MNRRRLLAAIKVVVSAVALAWVILAALRLWPQLAQEEWRFVWPLVAASLLLLLLTQVLFICGWHQSQIAAGGRPSWLGSARSQGLGQMGKYVPGKVVTLLGKVYFARQDGVREDTAATALFIETASQMAVAGAFGALYLLAARVPSDWSFRNVLWAGPLALLLLHPRCLRLMAATAARLTRRPPPDVPAQWRDSAALLVTYGAAFVVWGVAVQALAAGMGGAVSTPTAVSANALAWLVGFLSFIFAGGVGPREWVIAHLLAPQISLTTAAGVAIASRAALLLCESALALVCLCLRVPPQEAAQAATTRSEAAAGE